MKKQIIMVFFGVILVVTHSICATTFKERMQHVRNKAMDLVKKGGAKSKAVLSKMRFFDRARKEADAAREKLELCRNKNCKKELNSWRYGLHMKRDYVPGLAIRLLARCTQLKCSVENEIVAKAERKEAVAVLGLTAVVFGGFAGALGVVRGIVEHLDEKDWPKPPPSYEEAVRAKE